MATGNLVRMLDRSGARSQSLPCLMLARDASSGGPESQGRSATAPETFPSEPVS